jgi:predicted extracellular nuclease
LAAVLNQGALAAGESDPEYVAYLEEGNDPSGLDVGILVKRTRVEVLHFAQEGKSETFRNPINGQPELLNDRPPLVLTARVFPPAGVPSVITVIVNHLRSLIDIEDPVAGARVRAKRAGQAEFLAALLNRRGDDDPRERILVLGDLNAFEFNDGYVDVVDTIRGAPAPREQTVLPTRDLLDPDLVELIDALPPASRYSYVFDGTAQILDHILVTQTLQPFVATFSYVRGNADSPEVWRSDARRPERISDHDAALMYIRF